MIFIQKLFVLSFLKLTALTRYIIVIIIQCLTFMVFSNLYSTLFIIYIILVLDCLGVWLFNLIGSCKNGINTVLSTCSLGSLWFLMLGWDQKEALAER